MPKTLTYNVGDTVPGGKKSVRIVGQSETVLVYLTDSGTVAYNVSEQEGPEGEIVEALVRRALSCYSKAYADAKRAFSKQEWDAVRDELATALYSGLTAPNIENCADSFDNIEAKVRAKVADRGRLCYLLAATGSATMTFLVSLSILLFLTKGDETIYPLCAIFAIGGALASVITRISVVEISPAEDRRITALRGGYRIVLAVLLAAFMIVAAKANLIAGFVTNASWSLLAYSFLCGFSERFGPEILAKFEQDRPRGQGRKR